MHPLFAVDVLGFLFVFYALGFQTIVCMILGYYTAKRSLRGVAAWLFYGFIAGLIPVVGLVLMVAAYFFMPAPMTRSGPGYHPPKTREDAGRRRRSGTR